MVDLKSLVVSGSLLLGSLGGSVYSQEVEGVEKPDYASQSTVSGIREFGFLGRPKNYGFDMITTGFNPNIDYQGGNKHLLVSMNVYPTGKKILDRHLYVDSQEIASEISEGLVRRLNDKIEKEGGKDAFVTRVKLGKKIIDAGFAKNLGLSMRDVDNVSVIYNLDQVDSVLRAIKYIGFMRPGSYLVFDNKGIYYNGKGLQYDQDIDGFVFRAIAQGLSTNPRDNEVLSLREGKYIRDNPGDVIDLSEAFFKDFPWLRDDSSLAGK